MYDPVPDLAQLIDGLERIANGDRDNLFRHLSALSGPYARLRGGLLLDEPGWEDPLSTADALYTALREYSEHMKG